MSAQEVAEALALHQLGEQVRAPSLPCRLKTNPVPTYLVFLRTPVTLVLPRAESSPRTRARTARSGLGMCSRRARCVGRE